MIKLKQLGILLEWRQENGRGGGIKPRMINPNAFSNHFLTIADNINHNIPAQTIDNNRNYKYYLGSTLRSPFPKVRFINITTEDIEKVTSLVM